MMDDKTREITRDAWQAYNAMECTKQRHLAFLRGLEAREKNLHLQPSELDKALLADLLADHDQQVALFRDACAALKEQNADALREMLEYANRIDKALAPFQDNAA